MPIPPTLIDLLCDAHLGEAVNNKSLDRLFNTLFLIAFAIAFLGTTALLIALRRQRGTPLNRPRRFVLTALSVFLLPIQSLPPFLCGAALGESSVPILLQLLFALLSLPIIWLFILQMKALIHLWLYPTPAPTTSPPTTRDA